MFPQNFSFLKKTFEAGYLSGYIQSTTIVNPGSGYGPGTYTNVPLTGGNGTGAIGTVVVGGGGTITTVTITTPGTGYFPGNTLSASNATLGGSGSGFTVSVTTAFIPNLRGIGLSAAVGDQGILQT